MTEHEDNLINNSIAMEKAFNYIMSSKPKTKKEKQKLYDNSPLFPEEEISKYYAKD